MTGVEYGKDKLTVETPVDYAELTPEETQKCLGQSINTLTRTHKEKREREREIRHSFSIVMFRSFSFFRKGTSRLFLFFSWIGTGVLGIDGDAPPKGSTLALAQAAAAAAGHGHMAIMPVPAGISFSPSVSLSGFFSLACSRALHAFSLLSLSRSLLSNLI